MMRDKQKEGFVQGIVWAAGFISTDHDNDTYAIDIFNQAGISLDEAARFCCEHDLKRLRGAIPTLPTGKE